MPTWGYYQAFLLGLRDLGYIPGTNVTLEARFAEGRLDQIRGLVGELVGLPVDVLVLGATRAIREAMQATSTLPLVMAISNDPVGAQMVDSLSRPGGHLTGLTTNALALIPQELQLLRDVAPHVSRLTILGNRDTKAADQEFDAAQKAAAALGMDAVLVEESDPTRFRSRLRATRSHALFVLPDVIMNWNVGLLAALAADGSVGAGPVPALYGNGDFVRAGGLLALGPNRPAMYYRAAAYVDKILSGNSPGNLPIEGPPSLHRGVNVRAAQTLRVSVPKHILDDADFIAS